MLPENRDSGAYYVLGDYPGRDEVRTRRPMIGASGQLLERTLIQHGSWRQEAVIDNSTLCMAPGGDLRAFNVAVVRKRNEHIKKVNVDRKARGEPLLPAVPTPQEACRPHVLAQLERTPDVLATGKFAHWSITRKSVKIRKVRGAFSKLKLLSTGAVADETRTEFLWPGTSLRLVTTINAAYAIRSGPWQAVFEQDVGRFFRWRAGTLDWTDPVLLDMHPSPDKVRSFLRALRLSAYDLETTYADSLVCGLRTIGIYDMERKAGIVIPWLSILGGKGFAPGFERPRTYSTIEDHDTWKDVQWYDDYHYGHSEGEVIFRELVAYFRDPARTKVGHNNGYFDSMVLYRWLGIPHGEIKSQVDQILLARACDSELPRDLYTVGTLYTDVPSWKAAEDDRKIAHNPRSQEELAIYNNIDNAVVARTAPILTKRAAERRQSGVVEVDHGVQQVCRELHHMGLYVSEPIRARFEDELATKAVAAERTIHDVSGSSDFNVDSTAQLRRLLYEDWKLPVFKVTATGLASTDEDALRSLQVTRGVLTPDQASFLAAIWVYRTVTKALSNVVLPLRPASKGGRIGRSGLIYPHYNSHCYDGETEILTRSGWVRFDALEDGVEVAQWWASTGQINFAVPTAYRRDEYTGPMVRFENQACDLLVTPEHRMPLANTKGAVREFTATNIPRPGGLVSDWSTIHAGLYAGGSGLDFTAAEIRLIAMLQADGHIMPAPRGVQFGFRKSRKITRCREILDACGLVYTERGPTDKTPEHAFYVRREDFPAAVLAQLGDDKVFGPWVLDLTREQANTLLEEVWQWDAVAARQTQYTSTKQTNTDWLQALLVLSGVRTNQSVGYEDEETRNPLHILAVRRHTTNRITARATNETVPFSGRIYCVEVPSSWVVIRRNGKVTVSGNTPSTGRISSSDPNSQNWQKWIRAMISPRRGDHVFVQADYDQIELRLLSAVAFVEAYLEVFRNNGDPHAVTALMIYGQKFADELAKKKMHGIKTSLYEALRRFAKTFVYAVLYGGTAMTVYENVSKAINEETGELLFPDMTLAMVEAATRKWMEAAHQIPAWWDQQWGFAEREGYILEPILGRRRDFPIFERNEVINHPIQGGAGSIMHLGMLRLRNALPPDFAKGWGLVNQMHDAVTVECHERDADRVKAIVQETLTSRFEHIPGVAFTTEADVTVNWSEQKPNGRFIAQGLGIKLGDDEKPEVTPADARGFWWVKARERHGLFAVGADSIKQATLRASLRVARGEPIAVG